MFPVFITCIFKLFYFIVHHIYFKKNNQYYFSMYNLQHQTKFMVMIIYYIPNIGCSQFKYTFL